MIDMRFIRGWGDTELVPLGLHQQFSRLVISQLAARSGHRGAQTAALVPGQEEEEEQQADQEETDC